MKTFAAFAVAGSIAMFGLGSPGANAQGVRAEAAEHPRIAKAINALEDAINYMEHAPHDFGGHKAAAIASARNAVRDLRAALAFRAKEDRR